jgi:hypothetical protein
MGLITPTDLLVPSPFLWIAHSPRLLSVDAYEQVLDRNAVFSDQAEAITVLYAKFWEQLQRN